MDFTKGEIFEKFAEYRNLPKQNVIKSIFIYMEGKIGRKINELGQNKLKGTIEHWLKVFNNDFKSCHNKLDRLEMCNRRTWNVTLIIIQKKWVEALNDQLINPEPSSSGLGRPKKSVSELEKTSLYIFAKNIATGAENNIWVLLRACQIAANANSKIHLEEMLKKIKNNLNDIDDYSVQNMNNKSEVVKMDAEEALGFLIDNSLSKRKYTDFRLESKARNADIFPPYNLVREAKAVCRPEKESIFFSDTKALTTVRALTNHTARRIVEASEEILSSIIEEDKLIVVEAELILAYGGDGSTGHSMYHQLTSDGELINDNSMFTTSLTPLLLRTKDKKIIWRNDTPQSYRFNRPISLEFAKETREHVIKTFTDLKRQILIVEEESGVFHSQETPVLINFKFYPTIIDGKILNILTGTGSQTCPFCKKNPNDFNILENLNNIDFYANPENLIFGCQPLHAIINTFNGLLHISYKKEIMAWRSNKGTKKRVDDRKKKILEQLEKSFGIKFDKPRSGGSGTSTTGKLCRVAFNNPDKLAAALELDVDLIKNLSIILKVLNSHEDIDHEKFGDFCKNTYKLIVSLYPWYKLPATIHKILAHSSDIIMILPLSPGCFGEEGGESHNYFYKLARLMNARKTSRKENLMDVFYRAMDASDPVLSTKRLNTRLLRRRNRKIPLEVSYFFKEITMDEEEEPAEADLSYFSENFEEAIDNYYFEIDFEETE